MRSRRWPDERGRQAVQEQELQPGRHGQRRRQAKIQTKADELDCSLPLAEYILHLEWRLNDMDEALEGVYFRQ